MIGAPTGSRGSRPGALSRVIRNRTREALAGQNRSPEFADHRTKPADIRVISEQFESVVQTRAGLQEKGQVSGERRHFRRAWSTEKTETGPRSGNRCLVFDGFDRQQPEVLDAVSNLRRRGSR